MILMVIKQKVVPVRRCYIKKQNKVITIIVVVVVVVIITNKCYNISIETRRFAYE